MKALALGPEAPLQAVASGDFSGLSYPLLVAASCMQQLDEFVWKEGLICTEVKRFKEARWDFEHFERGKILILLPGWHECPDTACLVDGWVNVEDRLHR